MSNNRKKHAMKRTRPVVSLLLTVLTANVICAATEEPLIVPQPKHMGRGKWDIRLSTPEKSVSVIVVEPGMPKLTIGAEEINRYVEKSGGARLPVLEIGSEPEDIDTVIYLVADAGNLQKGHEAIGKAFSVSDTKIPDAQRCSQAYLIRHKASGSKRMVLLAGYGEQGGLYAAVTFCHMLRMRDNAVWSYQADVDDYPDFKYRGDLSFGAYITYAYISLYRRKEWNMEYIWNRQRTISISGFI